VLGGTDWADDVVQSASTANRSTAHWTETGLGRHQRRVMTVTSLRAEPRIRICCRIRTGSLTPYHPVHPKDQRVFEHKTIAGWCWAIRYASVGTDIDRGDGCLTLLQREGTPTVEQAEAAF
jgi:hypothetical protein